MPKTTSVYLSDEILEGLARTGLTPIQAIRAGIESHNVEQRLLKSMAGTLIEIRDYVKSDTARRHEIAHHSFPLDGYGGLEPRRAMCAQCLHHDHAGNCKTECELCVENAAYAVREKIRAGAIQTAHCSSLCDHDRGTHIPRKIAERQIAADDETLDAVHMPPPGSAAQAGYTETSPAIFHSPPQRFCDEDHDCNLPPPPVMVMTPEDTAGITEPVEFYAVCGYGCDERTQAQECPVHGWSEVR